MKRIFSLLAVLLVIALTRGTPEAAAQRRDRNRISRAEIERANAQSVYNLVESLRPAWRSRMTSVSLQRMSIDLLVYLDRARLGGLEELRQISPANVESVEYLDPGKTRYRFGEASSSGAIVVNTMKAPPPAPRDTTGLNVPPGS